MAQSIAVNPSSLVTEVGISNTFNLTLNPGTSAGYSHYKIDNWLIIANVGSGTIAGNINGQPSSNYYYNPPLGQTSSLSNTTTINIPITYGSNAPDTDNMEIQVSGFYGSMVNGAFFTGPSFLIKYTKQNGDSGYLVDVKTVCGPTISNPTILACSTDNVQICATGYCDANSFAWSVTGGSIVSGQGSSCITVSPIGNNNVTATCVAKRSSGLPNYTATNTRTITRTARSVNYTTIDTKNWLGIGAGRSLSLEAQNGVSSINWVAPGCTIVGQGTTDATITPTTSITGGTVIDVYANVTFTGGCTANSPINSYTVFNNENPPVPNGYIVSTPDDGNVCTATSFFLDFVGNNTSYFPVIITPRVIFATGVKSKQRNVEVCYRNSFTGINTCQSFGYLAPEPCIDQTTARLNSDATIATGIALFPNPTHGNFTVSFGREVSGNYKIYDSVGELTQKQDFSNKSNLIIDLDSKLKNEYYFVHLNIDGVTTVKTIVLQK